MKEVLMVELAEADGLEVSRYRLVRPDRGMGLVTDLLVELGEDISRPGLARTPKRAWESLLELTQGYFIEPEDVLGDAMFDESYDEMVSIGGIEFFSLCEHHMLPFFGRAHVAYVPDGRIVGLSKLPRIVDLFSRRLQVQERLTTQIADTLQDLLRPKGVGLVIEASHLCLMMRGVQKQSSLTTTTAMRGVFQTDSSIRNEFLSRSRAH
jgi:GTP cyclohydrolase IA